MKRLVIALSAAAVIVATGLIVVISHTPGQHAAGESTACIILKNGNKLCGDDAASYCRGFVKDGDNDGNIRACASIGVQRKTQAQLDAEKKAAADAAEAREYDRERPFEEAIAAELNGEDAVNGEDADKFMYVDESAGILRVETSFGDNENPDEVWEDTVPPVGSRPPSSFIDAVCTAARKNFPDERVHIETDSMVAGYFVCSGGFVAD